MEWLGVAIAMLMLAAAWVWCSESGDDGATGESRCRFDEECELESQGEEETTVLVVGAGPIGLSLALLLAEQNVPCIVVDKREGPIKVPAAHQLNMRSNEILLKDAKVPAEFLFSRATPEEEFRWVFFRTSLTSQPFARLNHVGFLHEEMAKNVSWARYLNIPQFHTEQALVDAIEALPPKKKALISLRYGHRAARCDFASKKAFIVSEGSHPSARAYSIAYKYAVDASGAAGVLRRKLDIQMEGPKGIKHVANVLVKVDLRDKFPVKESPLMNWVIAAPEPGVSIHNDLGKYMNIQFVYHPPYDKKEDFTPKRLERMVAGVIGDSDVPFQVEDVSFWRMDCQVAERYHDEASSVFLAGDSAHRFPPTGGLGMNSGIGDAHALAWRIGMVERGQASRTLLDQYETERRAAALQNSAISYDNFKRIDVVFKELGVDSDIGEKLAWVKHLLRFLPAAWMNWVFGAFQNAVLGYIQQKINDPAQDQLRSRVQDLLDLQRTHFNSYGLDLGFSYLPGQGIVEDADEAEAAGEPRRNHWRRGDGLGPKTIFSQMPHWTYSLEPSTRAGSRLPHVFECEPVEHCSASSIGPQDEPSDNHRMWSHSTHRHIDFRRFTLLCRPSANFKSIKASLEDAYPAILVARTATAKLPGIKDEQVCLLIRPDGYIAWRGKDPLVRVPQALASCLGDTN